MKSVFIKILFCLIIITIILFAFKFLNKVYVLRTFSQKSMAYYNETTNFYRKTKNNLDNSEIELWRKDNFAIVQINKDNHTEIVYYDDNYIWKFDGEDIIKNKIEEHVSIPTIETTPFYVSNIFETIQLAFLSKITTEKINGIDCFKIHTKLDRDEYDLYISKSNWLLSKEISNNTDIDYLDYEIDCVTDNDIDFYDIVQYYKANSD